MSFPHFGGIDIEAANFALLARMPLIPTISRSAHYFLARSASLI